MTKLDWEAIHKEYFVDHAIFAQCSLPQVNRWRLIILIASLPFC